jgi:hypothetical protein
MINFTLRLLQQFYHLEVMPTLSVNLHIYLATTSISANNLHLPAGTDDLPNLTSEVNYNIKLSISSTVLLAKILNLLKLIKS